MNIPKLSNRLAMVAGLVTSCQCIADIGTDHAYVPIYLVQKQICQQGLASDIKAGPAQKAAQNIAKYGLSSQISVAIAPGLAAVPMDHTEQIIIAGMGGEVICHILEAAKKQILPRHRLILQPQTDLPMVRRYLLTNGYCIAREYVVTEEHRVYNAMAANLCSEILPFTVKSVEIGHIAGSLQDVEAYYAKLHRKLSTEKAGLLRGGQGENPRIAHIDFILKELANEHITRNLHNTF